MNPLCWRLRRILGILPKVSTAEEVFDELREVVFSVNHIVVASNVLSDKNRNDLRIVRDMLTVSAIEIIEKSKAKQEEK